MWVGFGYGCWDWVGIWIGLDFLKSKIWGKIFGANCGPGFGILPVGVYGRGITPPRGGGKGMAMHPLCPRYAPIPIRIQSKIFKPQPFVQASSHSVPNINPNAS